jgi:hypothetical protein
MRNISTIMREGQEKTLEMIPLKEKQLAGKLTQDEAVRLGMLEGNLLALVKEAQAQGVGTAVGTEYTGVENDEGEDEDANLYDEGVWNEDEDAGEVEGFRFY